MTHGAAGRGAAEQRLGCLGGEEGADEGARVSAGVMGACGRRG